MSAFLAIAYVFVLGGPNHDAVVIFCRVAEQLHSSDRNLPELSHRLLRVDGSLIENGTNQNPNVAHEHAEAGQDEEFRELPTRHIALVCRTNGELFLPKRLANPSLQQVHG